MFTCVLILLKTRSRDSQIQPRAVHCGALPRDLAVLTNRVSNTRTHHRAEANGYLYVEKHATY